MNELEEKCLLVIVEESLKAEDSYVVTVKLPVSTTNERNMVVRSLESKGFISRVNIMGPQSVGCQVEEKAVKYALKYYEKR